MCTLVLLLLVGADLLSPAVPGVFSLALPEMFIDGAVQQFQRVPLSSVADTAPGSRRWVPDDRAVRMIPPTRSGPHETVRSTLRSHIKRGEPRTHPPGSPEEP